MSSNRPPNGSKKLKACTYIYIYHHNTCSLEEAAGHLHQGQGQHDGSWRDRKCKWSSSSTSRKPWETLLQSLLSPPPSPSGCHPSPSGCHLKRRSFARPPMDQWERLSVVVLGVWVYPSASRGCLLSFLNKVKTWTDFNWAWLKICEQEFCQKCEQDFLLPLSLCSLSLSLSAPSLSLSLAFFTLFVYLPPMCEGCNILFRLQCHRECTGNCSCWRPYQVECTGSLSTSEVKRLRARSVLGWGAAWEDLRVLSAFCFVQLLYVDLLKLASLKTRQSAFFSFL